MQIGMAALKCYFAEKGTGDIGDQVKVNDHIYKKESRLHGRNYFSVFGKIKIPRSCYRLEGFDSIMPLDAKANLPDRCYSYLLQEWMNLFSIRDSFKEAQESLNHLMGLNISQSQFEIINQETGIDYDEFYSNKKLPEASSEGELNVIGFDRKGVPVIKSEHAKIKGRLGKGEKKGSHSWC